MSGRRVWDGSAFSGTKAALVCGTQVAVMRRDAHPGLPWPGRIDLPGGARDGAESPLGCALREVSEEIGLILGETRIVWARAYRGGPLPSWMVAAEIDAAEAGSLRLGGEGQACWMMDIPAYLIAEDAIPHQQERVRDALAACGWPGACGDRPKRPRQE